MTGKIVDRTFTNGTAGMLYSKSDCSLSAIIYGHIQSAQQTDVEKDVVVVENLAARKAQRHERLMQALHLLDRCADVFALMQNVQNDMQR